MVPNVDDHGLEVLKKAARNIDPVPKKDYALQTYIVGDDSGGPGPFTPLISNHEIATPDTEVEISLSVNQKGFILKSRRSARLRISYQSNGTATEWVTIPLGGAWIESKRLTLNKIFVRSNVPTTLELIEYT